ncbi:tRNA pseudouridine(55) synthase TruB [Candidatus Kaiserbacteria bacterium]|nr:tRNA pseudouridine(55) synthase TruB [Candidatus Kaiserbacteria bacterium]
MTEEDILLIDKPKGITSFDVIRRLRKGRGERKMGHAGTLDPLASGLMIIGVGTGTKKLNEYIRLPKSYVAEILIGEKRSTGDMEGEVVESAKVESLDKDEVEKALKEMVGVLRLPVPVYSAVKAGGKRLYKEVRKGRAVIIPLRDMETKNAQLLSMRKEGDYYIVEVEFDVESGVYIRSLAEELGRRLGYPATTKELRRTKIGDFRIEDAEKII